MLIGIHSQSTVQAPTFGARRHPAGVKPQRNFSNTWFEGAVDGTWYGLPAGVNYWDHLLANLKGKPNLRFLEIGSFEGRSALWMVENVLTHPTAKLTCIDTFQGSQEHRNDPEQLLRLGTLFQKFKSNLAGHLSKIRIYRDFSRNVLGRLRRNHYDFIYVDGSHKAEDVYQDARLAFPRLKPGGLLVFDDYEWDHFQGTPEHPKPGIDRFLQEAQGQYSVVCKGYQLAIRKNPGP